MLKEVYVIEDGVHLFHYNLEDSEYDSTNLTLASGFLSAIQAFSQETRDSSIDYFSLENEFFLFDFLPRSNKHVVAIYEKSIEASVAREMLKHIVKEIKQTEIKKLSPGLNMTPREENKLKTKIRNIVKTRTSKDYLVEAADELFKKTKSVATLVVYDYHRKHIHYKKSRPKNTKEPELIDKIAKMNRAVNRFLKTLNLGNEFEIITIESLNYQVAISKVKTVLAYCRSSDNDPETIFQVPLRVMSIPAYENYYTNFEALSGVNLWQIDDLRNVNTMLGEALTKTSEDLLSNMVTTLEQVIGTTEEDLYNVMIYYNSPGYIKISKQFTLNEYHIESFTQV